MSTAAILLAAVMLLGMVRNPGPLVPRAASRFLRYFQASQTHNVQGSLYEKVVYSFVLATSPGAPHNTCS
ncbi:MAG: hypothetical protein ABI693_16040 [Bryobacteraceae bacterium]